MGRDSNGSTKVKDITATGIFQGGSGELSLIESQVTMRPWVVIMKSLT